MKVDVDLTIKDYEAFWRTAVQRVRIGQNSRPMTLEFWLIVGCGAAAWPILRFFSPSFLSEFPFAILLVLLLAGGTLLYFRDFHSLPLLVPEPGGVLLGPHTIALTPDGIEDLSVHSYLFSTWSAVRTIEETPEHLFVFVDQFVAYVIPRRCFAQPEKYEAFLDELWTYAPCSPEASGTGIARRLDTRRRFAYVALFLSIIFLSAVTLPRTPWQQSSRDQHHRWGRFSKERWQEGEALLASQFALVKKHTETLLSDRPGVVDSYFVGFGSDANQDVFMKEVLYAQQLFDRRYDTRGRSITLINNPKTTKEFPLASFTNLQTALQSVSQHMNLDEDILFLFLTSHGSSDHHLSVSYRPLPLKEIAPTDLANLLDEARIKWRVIIISACYSGGFINTLKNEHTLIITSSSATRPSFGCGEDDDLTYFGRAFLEDQLNRGIGIQHAFSGAATLIRQRELAQDLTPSEPQFFSSPTMNYKLQALEARLQLQHRQQ
ncbi:MAG: C13 family peptidase [Candidatus Binatia bacterium]